jgi:hypothetical protein
MHFQGSRVPDEPTTIAVLAIKVHTVFPSLSGNETPTDFANAIIAASRSFEDNRSCFKLEATPMTCA